MNRPSRIYATIDLDAVTWNLENMKKNISKDTKIIAVLKRMPMVMELFLSHSILNLCLIFGESQLPVGRRDGTS